MRHSVLWVIAVSVFCRAATHHVSPDGPVRSILQAVQAAGPGDTVLVADGVYQEDEIKIEDKRGSNANRLVVKALNRRQARIDSRTPWHVVSIWNSTGVTVEGFEITYNTSLTEGVHAGVFTTECDWITIRDNYIHDCGLSGIQPNQSDNVLVEGNLVVSNSYRSGGNGSGISVYHPKVKSDSPSGFGIIIRRNTCTGNWCDLRDARGNVTDGNGIIIDDFHNGQGGGEPGGYHKATLVENNLCYNNRGRGIHVFCSGNVVVRSNTLWHNNHVLQQYWDWLGDLSLAAAENVTVCNNIVVERPQNTQGRALWVDGSGHAVSSNIVVGDYTFESGSGSIDGGGNRDNITTDDDGFVCFVNAVTDPAQADFRLDASSPAVGGADPGQVPGDDITGNPRSRDGGLDIGAYETASDGPTAAAGRRCPLVGSRPDGVGAAYSLLGRRLTPASHPAANGHVAPLPRTGRAFIGVVGGQWGR